MSDYQILKFDFRNVVYIVVSIIGVALLGGNLGKLDLFNAFAYCQDKEWRIRQG